ncbi:hypothetical protein SK128_016993 [Halocaridina rubra]|uniref:Uncharacterized protein n=1 Tax=Halocaridina rubra TaxID=373956 RepID=A0AAN9AHM3_HALRR
MSQETLCFCINKFLIIKMRFLALLLVVLVAGLVSARPQSTAGTQGNQRIFGNLLGAAHGAFHGFLHPGSVHGGYGFGNPYGGFGGYPYGGYGYGYNPYGIYG